MGLGIFCVNSVAISHIRLGPSVDTSKIKACKISSRMVQIQPSTDDYYIKIMYTKDHGLSIDMVRNLYRMFKTLVGQCLIYSHTK